MENCCSAIANWESKMKEKDPEDNHLVVSEVTMDRKNVKKLRPFHKEEVIEYANVSNHVTFAVDKLSVENLQNKILNNGTKSK